jgi:hypothetical protein
MPSGAVTLLEAAKCGNDVLKRGVVETLIQESPILEQIPQVPVQGNALVKHVEVSLPSPEFRNVNEGYNRSWGSDDQTFWGTTILGGEVFVDNYLVRVRGNVVDVKSRQYTKYAKAMARTYDKYFFDGTGTAKDFKGLNALISEGFGQVRYAGDGAANGSALALSDLDLAFDDVRGQFSVDAILANRAHRRKITNLAYSTHSGYALVDVGDDKFGRKINMYNGVPIRIIGDDKDGNAILDFDETRGSSNVTSSLYLVAYDEDEGVTGLMGLGGSFDVKDFGETEAAPGHLGRVEVYPGLAVFNEHAVVRVAGILNS